MTIRDEETIQSLGQVPDVIKDFTAWSLGAEGRDYDTHKKIDQVRTEIIFGLGRGQKAEIIWPLPEPELEKEN